MSEEKGRPLPKFGDWDVNDPASAEGFTVIFNKARDEKKTGGKTDSPSNVNPGVKQSAAPVKKPSAHITVLVDQIRNGSAACKHLLRNPDMD